MVSCFLQGEGLSSRSCACLKQSDDCAGGGEEREQRAGADSAAPPAIAEPHSAFYPTAAPQPGAHHVPSIPGHLLPQRLCPRQLCGPAGWTDAGRVTWSAGAPSSAPGRPRRARRSPARCPRRGAALIPAPQARLQAGVGAVPAARTEPLQPAGGRAAPRLASPRPARPGLARSFPGGEKPLCSPPRESTAPAPGSQSGGGEGAPAPGGHRFPTREWGCGCCSALSAAAGGCDGRFYYYY